MYYNNEIIDYFQSNKILALKLDHVLSGVGKAVSDQIDTIGAGAKRALYYTSCFTDEYQDICKQQKSEDIRFSKGIYHLLQHGDVVYDMLKIYFEEIFKYKTSDQLEHIKKNTYGCECSHCCQFSDKSRFCFSGNIICRRWHESKS